MGCKLLEIMADGMYAVFHRFEAFLKKGWRTSSDCWIAIQWPLCFFNLCSSCSSRSNKQQRNCLLPPPMAGYAAAQASRPHHTPIAGLAIPLLTHTCCYSPATTDEPVNPHTPPCEKQLPSIPWLRVVPFLGLAVVHRHGALGAAWSTWSTNDIHRPWTARAK